MQTYRAEGFYQGPPHVGEPSAEPRSIEGCLPSDSCWSDRDIKAPTGERLHVFSLAAQFFHQYQQTQPKARKDAVCLSMYPTKLCNLKSKVA